MRFLALSFVLLAAASVRAQEVEVSGHVKQALHLSVADLKALPARTVQASFETSQGKITGSFVGVSVWLLVERAGLADGEGRHPDLRHSLEIHAHDGYRIMMSLGELDPDFGARDVILAYQKDGAALTDAEAPRLIVPGDRHGARNVRNVDRLTVD